MVVPRSIRVTRPAYEMREALEAAAMLILSRMYWCEGALLLSDIFRFPFRKSSPSRGNGGAGACRARRGSRASLPRRLAGSSFHGHDGHCPPWQVGPPSMICSNCLPVTATGGRRLSKGLSWSPRNPSQGCYTRTVGVTAHCPHDLTRALPSRSGRFIHCCDGMTARVRNGGLLHDSGLAGQNGRLRRFQ
jgi:hypothetical protein